MKTEAQRNITLAGALLSFDLITGAFLPDKGSWAN
jgi:hypothetical protein